VTTHVGVELVCGPAEEDDKGCIDGSVRGERGQLMPYDTEGSSPEHPIVTGDSPSDRLETDKVGCICEGRQEGHVEDDIGLERSIDEGDGCVPGEEAVEKDERGPEDGGDTLTRGGTRDGAGLRTRLDP